VEKRKDVEAERILALDISTKTGYCNLISSDIGMKLMDYGTLPQIHEPEGSYPSNYVIWAYDNFKGIKELIDKFKPEILIVEETSKGSKNGKSQKILEFTHFLLGQFIKDSGIKSVYLQTEEWRREIGCKMSDTEKLKNKAVRDYKKKFEKENSKKTTVAYDTNGKRIGLTGKKHVNVRRANEIFGDQLKESLILANEDLADALGLAACYHFRRLKVDNTEEVTMEDIIKDKI